MKTDFKITYFFWIKRKDKNKRIPVYIRSKQNSDKQYSYYTGEKVLMNDLKPVTIGKMKTYRLKNKSEKLMTLEAKIQGTYTDLVDQGHEPTLEIILNHLNDKRKPKTQKILDWCNDYLESSKYSPGQKKGVATLKENIQSWKPAINFDKLTDVMLENFTDWLTEREVANNSQYKRIRSLVNVAKHARVDLPHLREYKLPYDTGNAEKVRLDWPEVKRVMDTKPETTIEAVAKDIFLLACFSGLRISDIMTLKKGKLRDFYYERPAQTKTKKPVYVTLHKYNIDLFNKYFDRVPYSRQNLSSALKPLLDRAGLTEEVTLCRQVGYNILEETKYKWEEIAFHSGRRFYSRLLNDLGLGGEIARDELGHAYKGVTELYAGSPNHRLRINRVREAIEGMEKTLERIGLMKVA
jgi:integrase